MPYTLRLEPGPRRALLRLNQKQPKIVVEVLDALEHLAKQPTRLSSPVDYPYPTGQKFECYAGEPQCRYHFTCIFQYGDDEETIYVRGIGWSIE